MCLTSHHDVYRAHLYLSALAVDGHEFYLRAPTAYGARLAVGEDGAKSRVVLLEKN
jgi:hypothetical protein